MAPALTIITDFDGTVCRLDIDWSEVRRRAAVARIGELWERAEPAAWASVTAAEVTAATIAAPIPEVTEILAGSTGYAVISNNSAGAVAAFLRRHPLLAARCRLVIGREELGGPKEDEDRFAAAFARCLAALGAEKAGDVAYLGDQDYELAFAARCGARVRRVSAAGMLEEVGTDRAEPVERDGVSELDAISREYLQRPPDREVDAVFIDAIAEYVVARVSGSSVIELGLGDRVWTPRLLRRFDRVVSVDGSAQLVAAASATYADPRWQGVVSYFEEFTPDRPVDVVLATGVLEHVDDPEGVLRRARDWLVDGGEIVVTVPNGESLHRQLAKVMGLVDDPTTPGEADRRLGHRHVFTLDRLLATVEAAGYVVLEVEGLLAKTLPNSVHVACSDAQLRGLVEVGRLLPARLAATLYVRARLPSTPDE